MNNFTSNQKSKLNRQVRMLLMDEDARAFFNMYRNLHLTKERVKDIMDENRNDNLPDYENSYIVLCELFGKNDIDEWVKNTAESEMNLKEYEWYIVLCRLFGKNDIDERVKNTAESEIDLK